MLTLLWLSCLVSLVISVVKISVVEISVIGVSARFVVEATFVIFFLSTIALSIFCVALCV